MNNPIVLISGSISSGKSTLCDSLVRNFGAQPFKTKDLLQTISSTTTERRSLQALGQRLDRRTNGTWVKDALAKRLNDYAPDRPIIVDAVRIVKQVEAFREVFRDRVLHIHLDAPTSTLAERYNNRKLTRSGELPTYEDVKRNRTERHVHELAASADILIDTSQSTPEDVLIRAASHLGLYGREYLRLVDVLVGGQYGSEGKGHIASYLAREYDILIRIGGPNAGHKVFEAEAPYTHHQLPSGTRRTQAHLILGPGSLINPEALLEEVAQCEISQDRLSIDPNAMIIEGRDRKAEGNLVKSIGSTGQGVGAATARRIMGRSAGPSIRLAKDLRDLRPFIRETCGVLEKAYSEGKKIFLEGTQGTGLSLFHGSYPHVTSRDTCAAGCLSEAGVAPNRVRRIVMVCRTYPIRVQSPAGSTSGFMSQELSWEQIEDRAGLPANSLRPLELTSTTKRQRRVAEFDWRLLRKAASLNGPTDIALTFADYISAANTDARRFEQLTPSTLRFIEEVERVAGAPVSLVSTRFHSRGIIDRRRW